MKSVLISIKPKWCEKICHQIGEENGNPVYEKRVEIRKSKSSCEVPFKAYIYCTQSGKYIDGKQVMNIWMNRGTDNRYIGNGKVIGEFVCDKIDTYYYRNMDYPIPKFEGDDSVYEVGNGYYITSGELEKTCLTYEELEDYGKGKTLYGWHISDIVIYDKPKELSEFYTKKICNSCKKSGYESTACMYDEDCKVPVPITRAPQSWCYVEELKEIKK